MGTHNRVQATLVGIPLDLGAENLGVDVGPQAFRYAKVVEKLESVGFEITDVGNITPRERKDLDPGDPHMRYAEEIIRVSEETAKVAASSVKAGRKVIALGGDHSLCLGVVSGASVALDGELGMIYLDAHGDMNTDETTLSGNIHGMHVASLLGFGAPELKHLYGPSVKVTKENFLHIGGSDFDPAELELIAKEKLQAFTLMDLLSQNLSPLLAMIDDLASRVKHIWVSLDLDVIDQIYAPGAGMPNAKGLTYREIATIAEYIGQSCPVVGVDVAEYNPLHDENGKTAELGIELIAKLLGKNYSWYTNYMNANKISKPAASGPSSGLPQL